MNDENDDINFEHITGKVEYSYSMGKAIENNYICDYWDDGERVVNYDED